MKKLTFILLLAAGCGDSNNKTTVDAPPPPVDAAMADGPPPCFSGTATTHDQLINACVDQSVTVIHKMPVLPLLNSDGTLPPLL